MSYEILQGDCLQTLCTVPDACVQTCVTSPPYYGLRDYRHDGQIGLEETPDAYVAKLVDVFREVRRVLRADGTLWVVIGDSMRDKQLFGIPWRTAFALQGDGWYLRMDCIWHKPNPMPESVTDRPTKAHEYIFLLSKSAQYYYDTDAIKEPQITRQIGRIYGSRGNHGYNLASGNQRDKSGSYGDGENRNKRSVWTIAIKPTAHAHFATFPPDLIEPCILAGSAAGDTVLDPFSGSGTTGVVALKHHRHYIGCELNPDYIELSHKRITQGQPMLLMEVGR